MTTPYVTGTVSVTAGSAIVTGTGTGWQTAGLVAGVFGLDSANGNPIPVLSVDSDTQITLAKPWRGTTASGQAYWITYDTTPGQQSVSNAQRLAEYIARLDKPALAALASLVPAADKLPYFGAGGAGALADFNAAARALLAGGVLPNSQFPTRLRELPTIVASLDSIAVTGWTCAIETTAGIPPGGQYWLVNTIVWPNGTDIVQIAYHFFGAGMSVMKRYRSGSSGTWSAWKSSGSSTLGTVSQTGGIATGAIIERGSNANGEYTRFADGTQICWGSFVGYTAFVIKSVATAALFSTAIKPCFVSVTPFGAPDASPEAWSDAVNVLNFRSAITSTTNRVDYCVIGRWY